MEDKLHTAALEIQLYSKCTRFHIEERVSEMAPCLPSQAAHNGHLVDCHPLQQAKQS